MAEFALHDYLHPDRVIPGLDPNKILKITSHGTGSYVQVGHAAHAVSESPDEVEAAIDAAKAQDAAKA